MTMMPTPNFVLMDYFTSGSISDQKILPPGTFVRPIDVRYVPDHVLNDPRWVFFNKEKEVFCYTSIGIVAIKKDLLRQV